MTLASPKGSSTMSAFPRTLSSIAVSVGGMALFLIFASWLSISHPIGSTQKEEATTGSVSSYVTEEVEIANPEPNNSGNLHTGSMDASPNSFFYPKMDVMPSVPPLASNATKIGLDDSGSMDASPNSSYHPKMEVVPSVPPLASNATKIGSDDSGSMDASPNSSFYPKIDVVPSVPPLASNATKIGLDDSGSMDASSNSSSYPKMDVAPSVPPLASNVTKIGSDDSGCDLYSGHWYYDSTGPLYTNNTCPIVTQTQNCQGNGRPDKEYENWRWKPSQCELPRFDGKKFLELMRGKTLAFIGDSLARNQMESLLCILWQVEVPKSRGYRKMQRWYFRSTSVMIVRIWSAWLVHKTSEPIDFAPDDVVKLHLDAPDEDFMDFIPTFDVIVISSGHWFPRKAVYILNNEIVGGQLWWPEKSPAKKIDSIEAYGVSVETSLTAIVTHPNYTGLTIVRSYSPNHYEGGAWNTGGSCTGKVRPLAAGELVENGYTNIMHEKQVTGFNRAIKNQSNKSKLRLMDITEVFGYRHDGHPGPYRSPDPNKITKRGPDGKPPPQDCLHWCMPGPTDTWNEFLLEIIRGEFEGNQSFPS